MAEPVVKCGPGKPPPGIKASQVKDATGKIRRKVDLEPPPPRIEGDFDRLKTMRYVLNNPAKCDRTEGERAMRAFLEKNPGQFMQTFDELVREEKEAVERPVEEPVERTESDQELHRLLDELISRALERSARPPRR